MPGLFITYEGGEAAGKSTQIKLLARRLESLGREIVVTREPGGTDGAEGIREVVKSARYAFGPVSQRLLFVAARRDLIDKVIAPAILRGAIVLCDRFLHSTLAYQGGEDPKAWQAILADHALFNDNLVPDVALYLDVDVAIAAKRLVVRGVADDDVFEGRGRSFHEGVRRAYLALAANKIANLQTVDADGDPELVSNRLWLKVANYLRRIDDDRS